MICFSVGSGIGPETFAPLRFAVSMIFSALWSISSWSYAFRRIRIFCAFAMMVFSSSYVCHTLNNVLTRYGEKLQPRRVYHARA